MIRILFEHLIYSTSIAFLFGMIYRGLIGKEYSWIIILSAFIMDIIAIYAIGISFLLLLLITGKSIVR